MSAHADPQHEAPYLDALAAYAARAPARLHVPGHKGLAGADPALAAAIGERALALDIPALTWGIDLGPSPTPFERAQRLAADAWGARRSWFLVNGASQANVVIGLALAHAGREVIVQRNVHSSTIDALIVAGLRPVFVAPALDAELRVAHGLEPAVLARALAEHPDAVAAWTVSPTYYGAVADVAALAQATRAHGVPLIVDEAWGAHLAFHPELPRHALACGADLAISSTHKILGSLTQSAILHVGHGAPAWLDDVVDRAVTLVESTSPSALLSGSLDAARRRAVVHGRELLGVTLRMAERAREQIRAIPGLDVLDERAVGRPGMFAHDPLRLVVDVRGLAADGHALAVLLRELDDVHCELQTQDVVVALLGLGEAAAPHVERFVAALRVAAERVGVRGGRQGEPFVPPPPWGELAMVPREAFLGPQEAVPARAAVGRISAESLAAYPPGIPNVLPGERLTAETLSYLERTLEVGGSVRGASDRLLRTIRVAAGR